MKISEFLSTLSLRRATDACIRLRRLLAISIHALLAESDTSLVVIGTNCVISIHALLAESDRCAACALPSAMIFLSTLSLRRATKTQSSASSLSSFLSTLSLRRATDVIAVMTEAQSISIHALLAESDLTASTEATKNAQISIHALLAESDLQNWRKPHERKTFLSTLSLRRATCLRCCAISCITISIHALLAESDRKIRPVAPDISSFLSTLSLRRATAKVHKTVGHFCAYETNFMGIASSC